MTVGNPDEPSGPESPAGSPPEPESREVQEAPATIEPDRAPAVAPGSALDGSEPEPVAVSEPEPVAVSEPEPVAVSEPEPEPEPVAVSGPEPVAVSEPEPVAVSEPEPEPVAVSEPEPVAVSDSSARPGAGTGTEGVAPPVVASSETSTAPVQDDLAAAADMPATGGDDAQPAPSAQASITPPAGRRPRRRLLVLAAVTAAVLTAAAGLVAWSPWSGLPEDAALRVAGTVVTEVEVQRRTDVLSALYGVQIPEEPERLDRFRRDTAKALAISLVLDRAAEAEGIRTANKTVSDALDRFLAQRYPEGGRAAYVRALTAQGVGERDVLDEIRRQLEIRELFDRTTRDVSVSDTELEALFRADPAQYATPERRQVRHIVVADMASAQAVLRRLQSGEDFAAVSAQTSLDGSTKDQGGDLGLLAASELESSFANVAFAVAPASLFGPVQTSLGWHVGMVEQVVAGSPSTFVEVREQLREQQETERAVALWRDFVLERVEAAEVEYAPDYRPDDPRPDLDGAPATQDAPSQVPAG